MKPFGSVTVMDGHIHRVIQKVEAMSPSSQAWAADTVTVTIDNFSRMSSP